MAVRTNEYAGRPTGALQKYLAGVTGIKKTMRGIRSRFDDPEINLDVLHGGIYVHLFPERVRLQAAMGIAGIVQEAKDDSGDQTYDLVAEHAIFIAKLDEVLLWSETNYPTTSTIIFDVAAERGVKWATMTNVELAPLATLLDELQALMD